MIELPAAFLSGMRAMLGDEYDAFHASFAREPERGMRLNPLRAAEYGADAVPWEPDGRYVTADIRPGRDLAHFSGAYYMQDPSAMAPARVLDARPGERILDLCAAPGGKSGQIAAVLGGRGALVSNEPDAARAKALAGNLERLGVSNALVVAARPDALAGLWPGLFDAILVDAPCSGEGMFRRDAAARAEWSDRAPAGCAQRQTDILRAAAKMLRVGGRLVYSTCTFNEVENEGTVRGFLGEHPEFESVDFALPGVGESSEGMLRLWPHRLRGEGHFVALMRKVESAEPRPAEGKKKPPLGTAGSGCAKGAEPSADRALAQLRAAIPGEWPALIEGWTLRVWGNLLCALPPSLPAFDGLKVLRMGLHLCQIGAGHVRPDHALAMALRVDQLDRTLELDEIAARRFVRGEEIPCPEALAGWTLAAHNGLPMGWGKAVQGALKNHVPKGVRMN